MREAGLTNFFDHHFSINKPEDFKVTYTNKIGETLNGKVRLINKDHYEVFIEEKEVIIHCTRNESGGFCCSLNTQKNTAWVDGISRAVSEKVRTER